jgi:predicted oxidoreductase (fatty acid repression mutant protein)
VRKEEEQVRALRTMWAKVGSNIKTYNDLLSTSTTSTSVDKETWQIYAQRQGGCVEEDQAPYLLPNTPATTKIKKIFL